MDGVIVDFDGYKDKLGLTVDQVKKKHGAYLEMLPFPEAVSSIRTLIAEGYDIWLATKPPTGISFAYSDKAEWVFKHFPELKRKLIITPDKGMLGDRFDVLVDDRPDKANCRQFRGLLIPFVDGRTWDDIMRTIHNLIHKRK